MGQSLSVKMAYGVDLGGDEASWQLEETEDYDYVLPWEEGRDPDEEECDANSPSSLICRFLLKRLPDEPCGEEIDEKYSWELEELLTERTGLSLFRYGYEYGCTLLASGPTTTGYNAGPWDVTAETLKVTEEQEQWLSWAMETLGVTFKDKPGIKVMASFG